MRGVELGLSQEGAEEGVDFAYGIGWGSRVCVR